MVTAVAQGLIGSYFAKNAIFFATAALCVPALVVLSFIKPEEIDYCRARTLAATLIAPAMPISIALAS